MSHTNSKKLGKPTHKAPRGRPPSGQENLTERVTVCLSKTAHARIKALADQMRIAVSTLIAAIVNDRVPAPRAPANPIFLDAVAQVSNALVDVEFRLRKDVSAEASACRELLHQCRHDLAHIRERLLP
jgi:hypothetical protein